MLKYSIPAMKHLANPACYMAKQHRALYLTDIPHDTKFHTVSNRCFARHEPMGNSKGLWIHNFHELEVVSSLKTDNAYWYQIRLTENNVDCPTYWVYEHCITPTRFGYIKAKFLSLFR